MELEVVRVGTYRWLAAALQRPTAAGSHILAREDALRPLRKALALLPRQTAFSRDLQLRRFLNDLAANPEAVAADLSLEHCRLFVGPDALPCPPYGSVYLDGGQTMGPSTFDAMTRYREQGLAVGGSWLEPPDHIAIELDFMGWLATKCLGASEQGDDEALCAGLNAQRRFLDNHLGRWAPAFSERLRRAASMPLYCFLSEFVPDFLARDRNLLDALAGVLPPEAARCG